MYKNWGKKSLKNTYTHFCCATDYKNQKGHNWTGNHKTRGGDAEKKRPHRNMS